jgi:hypothetical protein
MAWYAILLTSLTDRAMTPGTWLAKKGVTPSSGCYGLVTFSRVHPGESFCPTGEFLTTDPGRQLSAHRDNYAPGPLQLHGIGGSMFFAHRTFPT